MSEPRRWYHSLYWRLATGLFAFLVLVAAAQAALYIWMINQTAGSMPANSPGRLAVLVASDVGAALAETPSLDLAAYVQEQYEQVFQPFVIIMRDGRVVSNRADVPEELEQAIRIERVRPEPPRRGGRRGDSDGSGALSPPPRGRGGGPARPWEVAPIIVAGAPVGRVVVLGATPFRRIVRELGPPMAAVAVGVLAAAATLIALFVFGPARRRLKEVESATEQLGAGNLSARVPADGRDEVASVARAFNRMADELASRAAALRASEVVRRQLLADVSHELMTPLTAMRGYVETLRMQELAVDSATRDRYLGIIDEETHRLERLVGDLLELARLEGGGGQLRSEPVSIEALFERVQARHEYEIQSRRVRLTTEVAAGAEEVQGDPDRLEQALQNLAANAVRHTPDGGEIRLSSRPDGDRVHIEVRDSGPGIEVDHLPHIFERFYKADSARRSASGSGLGLSIVKAIIERHGGTITARNDHGAVFDIVLPRTKT